MASVFRLTCAVEGPSSSEPKQSPTTDMEGWEDVDSDFEEFGYSRSATQAVPSCGKLHT